MISGAIGVGIAALSSAVTFGTAVWASRKPTLIASVATSITISLKLVVLAGVLWFFLNLGYAMSSLLIGFGVTYAILLGVEVAWLNKERGRR